MYDPDRHGSRFMLTGRAEPAAPRAEASAHREPGGRRVSTAIGHRMVDAGGAAAGRPTVMKRASTGQWENQAVPQWGTSSHNPRVQVQGEPSKGAVRQRTHELWMGTFTSGRARRSDSNQAFSLCPLVIRQERGMRHGAVHPPVLGHGCGEDLKGAYLVNMKFAELCVH